MIQRVLLLLLFLIPSLTLGAGIADFNPISHWKLDETSGTRVDEASTWDLTDVNSVGYISGALNNASDHVFASSEYLRTASDFTELSGDSAFTINFWYKTSTDATDGPFLISINDGVDSTVQINKTYLGNTFSCYAKSTGSGGVTSPTIAEATIIDGSWSMLSCVYDGSKLRFYENCVESGTGTAMSGTVVDTGASFVIGGRYPSPTGYSTASYDEVSVFPTGMSSSTLCTLYNSGTPLGYESTSGGTTTATSSTSTVAMDDTNFLLVVLISMVFLGVLGFLFSPLSK